MALSFLYNYCWFKLLPNRSKVVEGVIPEDMINEQWVYIKKTGANRYIYNLSIFFSNKKMVEGVIPEEIVNECTTRRQELIGTCTIWVFLFFSSNQSSFCLIYDNDQSEQRKISQGANGNSEWNEVKFSVGKCQSSSPDYFKFWIWLDESLRERGKFFWANLTTNVNTTSSKQVMRIKKNIN